MPYRRKEQTGARIRHGFAAAFRLIRRPGRRPALPVGAGLSQARRRARPPPTSSPQVVETAPGFATAWFALASIRERLGDRDGAIAAFAAARDADREDYHGARLHLARLGVGEATPAMTGVYVRRLFDQHAPEFDEALTGRLDYRRAQASARRGAGARERAAAVRLGARSRLRHGAERRGVPALLRLADRRRHLARHGRAGARQGPLRPACGLRPAGISRRRSRRAEPSGAGRRRVRLLQRHRADCRRRRQGARARRAVRVLGRDRRPAGRAAAGNLALRPQRRSRARRHRSSRAASSCNSPTLRPARKRASRCAV